MPLKDADGIANSKDPDQTAPLGVSSLTASFTQIYQCENSENYCTLLKIIILKFNISDGSDESTYL